MHSARPPLIESDLPMLVQEQCYVAGCDVVGWVESVCLRLFGVDISMVDNKEMS